jgi:MFS family permease
LYLALHILRTTSKKKDTAIMEALEMEPMIPLPSSTTHIQTDAEKEEEQNTIGNKEFSSCSSSSLTYWTLLRSNRPFTLYLCSYITNHTGEWLTYLASLTALRQMQQQQDGSQVTSTSIGVLVAVRLLTNVLAAPWGGALADAMDRRKAMIVLDLVGAFVALVFLAAVQYQSPFLIYLATFVQEFDSGLYEPSKSAIVPLLCPTDTMLEKATMLTSMAWSIVAAVASAAGGVLVSILGLQGCFIVDSITYLISAWFLTCIPNGKYWTSSTTTTTQPQQQPASTQDTTTQPQKTTHNHNNSLWTAVYMMQDGWRYLWTNPWGPLVGLKFSVTWLTMDVLMVDFATRGGNGIQSTSSLYLGALFGAVGV